MAILGSLIYIFCGPLLLHTGWLTCLFIIRCLTWWMVELERGASIKGVSIKSIGSKCLWSTIAASQNVNFQCYTLSLKFSRAICESSRLMLASCRLWESSRTKSRVPFSSRDPSRRIIFALFHTGWSYSVKRDMLCPQSTFHENTSLRFCTFDTQEIIVKWYGYSRHTCRWEIYLRADTGGQERYVRW